MSNDGGNDLAAILSEVDTNVTNIQASLQSLDSKIGMMDTVSQRTLFQEIDCAKYGQWFVFT